MLARALDAGVPATWVTADEAYGGDSKFRRWLETGASAMSWRCPAARPSPLWPAPHVPMCSSLTRPRTRGNAAAAATAPRDRGCSTGPSPSYRPTPTPPHQAGQRWLLARRSLTPNSKGEYEIAYYLCCAPTGTTDDDLIRVAGARWAIEDCFQTAKNRRRPRPLPGPPLRRLVPAHHPRNARPHLPSRHRRDRPKSPGSGLIPVTLGEVKRLLAHLITTPSTAP